jgi:hypothetical protein
MDRFSGVLSLGFKAHGAPPCAPGVIEPLAPAEGEKALRQIGD